ncbi:ion channel, partial [Nocardioides sp. ChNu-99]
MLDNTPLDVLLVVAGALVVLGVLVDALMTTLSVSAGAGPLTSRVVGVCWRVAVRRHRQDDESSFLTGVGSVLLVGTVLTWVLLLWTGWALVLAGSGSVVDSTTRVPAGAADVVYFTGFTLFTLGTGDFVAHDPEWREVTALASFCGLFIVTLAITYLISVVSAVVSRRALAVQIHALGDTAPEMVARAWVGDRFSDMFEQQLIGLLPAVATSAEQHLAYPALDYFHSSRPALAAPTAVAQLDEALTVLTHGVPETERPDANALRPLRYALSRYLSAAADSGWPRDV